MLVLFIIFTLEIAARVVVSGFILNAAEYSTIDRQKGIRAVISDQYNAYFRPERQETVKTPRQEVFGPSTFARSFTMMHGQRLPETVEEQQRMQLARRAFLRHGFNRLDFIAVVSFWITFALSITGLEMRHHLFVFRMMSCLRIVRLVAITNGTAIILRSLKKAAPLLVRVAFLIGFFWLLFAIIGVQSFKSSLSRHCVWRDPLQPNNFSASFSNSDAFCGGHLDNQTGEPLPWVRSPFPDSFEVLEPGTDDAKGFLCPRGSVCLEQESPNNGTVNFDDIVHSLELVFVIMSANTWSDLMYSTTKSDFLPAALFYGAGIMIMMLWLTNLMIAVITSSFQVIREESKASAFTSAQEAINLEENERLLRTSKIQRIYDKTWLVWVLIIAFDLLCQSLRSHDMPPLRANIIFATEIVVTILLDFEIIISGIGNLIVFVFLITYIMAIFAVQLFRGEIPLYDDDGELIKISFYNMFNSFIGMYQILSSENWTSILYDVTSYTTALDTSWYGAAFLIGWFTLSWFIIVNMFIAVIQENFDVSEDEKRLEQVKAFLQRKELGSHATSTLALSEIFSFGRSRKKKDPLDYGPATMEMLLKDAVVREFLDDTLDPLQEDPSRSQSSLHGGKSAVKMNFVSSAWGKVRNTFSSKEPNPFYTNLRFDMPNDTLDPRQMARQVVTAAAARQYWQLHEFQPSNWFVWIDTSFAILFSVEAVIKIVADGLFFTPNAYYRSSWGIIDGVVLISLWINVITILSSNGAVSRAVVAGWKIVSAAFVSLSLLIPFAIYATTLFNGQFVLCNDDSITFLNECFGEFESSPFNPDWPLLAPRVAANPFYDFDDFGSSLFILFQIVSQEGWVDVSFSAQAITGRGTQPRDFTAIGNAMFFVVFNLLGTVFVLTLFISVFMRNYTEQTGVAFLTADQRSWLELRKLLRQISPSRTSYHETGKKWKKWCHKRAIEKRGKWYTAITTVLVLHLIFLMLEYYPEPEWWTNTRNVIFLLFTFIYIANIGIRIAGFGWKRFRKSSWDVYSLFAVAGAFTTSVMLISKRDVETFAQLHKFFLVAIVLLLIPRNDALDQLFKTAAASLSTIINLLATWLVFFLVFAIALTQTFSLTRFGPNEDSNVNFRTVPNALILLFRMSVGEGWNELMEDYATIAPPLCVEDPDFFETDCGSTSWARTLFIAWNLKVQERRRRFNIFCEEVMVSADPDRGISFTTVLMIMAHYKIISDNKSLRLEEFLRRRARLQRVEEEVRRRVVLGFFDTLYWSRRFKKHMEKKRAGRMTAIPQLDVPDIFIDDEEERAKGTPQRSTMAATPRASGTKSSDLLSSPDAARPLHKSCFEIQEPSPPTGEGSSTQAVSPAQVRDLLDDSVWVESIRRSATIRKSVRKTDWSAYR
ncbi:putative ion transporter protein [Eutypa lata UCREL1]|uniref:Calcium-channel protein CCH1 n=1 Tax=Eutypa lata (strain UCR-EL1) TaxID=1287681 RepID=M7TVL3_EUTLA|nr:putative ion transporter protein [Eutypa lata UCREL1]